MVNEKAETQSVIDFELPSVCDDLAELVVTLACACMCGLMVGSGSGNGDKKE